MTTLGNYIRNQRDELDISLREFAKSLDLSPSFISDIELGRRYPSEEVLRDIARVLKVSIEELREKDSRPPLEALKKKVANDPHFAVAFRRVINEDISSEDLIDFLNKKKK